MFKVESRFKALGTDIFLAIVCAEENERERARKDLGDAQEIYQAKEKILSRFDKESELSFLNNNLGKFSKVSKDILGVSQLALKYNSKTQGLFDPRIIEKLENIGYKQDFSKKDFKVDLSAIKNIAGKLENDLKTKENQVCFGKRMDFSGIAKGYITDQVVEFLKNKGWKNFLVDSGGDIFAQGLAETGEKWKIALENISEEKMMLEASSEAVATSGITRRKWKSGERKFHHLINPQNPDKFNFDLQSVTVVAENTTRADVLAKILFLMGRERGLEFSKAENIKSLFLDYKSNLYFSQKAKENLLI